MLYSTPMATKQHNYQNRIIGDPHILQRCSKRLSPSKIWFADPKLLVLQSIPSDGSMFLRTAVVGKPVIKGTRIPVELVLERLEEDTDTKLLFEDYPQLTNEDIKACLRYAKELVKGEEVYPASYSHTA